MTKRVHAWTTTSGIFLLNDTRAYMTWCFA